MEYYRMRVLIPGEEAAECVSSSQQSSSDSSVPANVFGVELHHLVEKEGCAAPIPLLIQKCVSEIERRGLKV